MSGVSKSGTPLPVLADRLMVHLRRCGVVAHQVRPMPTAVSGERSVVVFLSKTMDQRHLARATVLRIPEVKRATLAGYCPTVMFVYLRAEPRSRRS